MSDVSGAPKPAFRTVSAHLKSPWGLIVLILALVAVLDGNNLISVVLFAANALANTAPYILFAVLLLAYLKATGAEVSVARVFQGRETRMILMAAVFGGLAPFCSCEVIPFVAGLLALGAPLSAVMAFWLSSPLIDPPTLLITAGALGWEFAIGKAIFAVALGLFGGFVIKAMMRKGAFSSPLRGQKPDLGCGCGGPKLDAPPEWKFWRTADRRNVFGQEFRTNAVFLVKWLAFAYVLEALLVSYVPADLIARAVGGTGLLPIITAAFVGMPAYLNSYVAPPLLAGLVDQGMSTGAAMAFMISGAVSSVPAMAAVWSLVTPRVFLSYLCLGITGAILAGTVFQLI